MCKLSWSLCFSGNEKHEEQENKRNLGGRNNRKTQIRKFHPCFRTVLRDFVTQGRAGSDIGLVELENHVFQPVSATSKRMFTSDLDCLALLLPSPTLSTGHRGCPSRYPSSLPKWFAWMVYSVLIDVTRSTLVDLGSTTCCQCLSFL